MTFVLKNKDRVRAISFILLIQKSVYVNIFTNRKKLQKNCELNIKVWFYILVLLSTNQAKTQSKFWRTSRTIAAALLHCAIIALIGAVNRLRAQKHPLENTVVPLELIVKLWPQTPKAKNPKGPRADTKIL